jgi:hypothetical protein
VVLIKTALSISKDSGFSVDEDTSIKIDNWSDILKYKEENSEADFDPATFKPENYWWSDSRWHWWDRQHW